jgi:hypothetical protein
MSGLGYSCYGASGYGFWAEVTTILALEHLESVIGIHPTTLESPCPVVDDTEPISSGAHPAQRLDLAQRGLAARLLSFSSAALRSSCCDYGE